MVSLLLAAILALCSVMGFVNVVALYKAKALIGVSVWPTAVYAVANALQVYQFTGDGHWAAAAGMGLCFVANAMWLGLVAHYRHSS